jgi:hypothetical protein
MIGFRYIDAILVLDVIVYDVRGLLDSVVVVVHDSWLELLFWKGYQNRQDRSEEGRTR